MISTFLRRLATFALGAVLLAGSSLVGADTPSFAGKRVVVSSHESFDQVNNNIPSLVARSGMKIIAQVDQGKMLSTPGRQVQARLYLIGNPAVGRTLFNADAGVGLYMPLRLAVYRSGGTTYIEYDQPSSLLGQFSNPQLAKMGKMLDQKLDKLVAMARH